MSRVSLASFAIVFLGVATAGKAALYVRGKVVMEDGSLPPKSVEILRTCGGHDIHEASTDRKGEFLIPDPLYDMVRAGTISSEIGSAACFLRASLPGYDSTVIDLSERTTAFDPILPAFVLTPRNPDASAGIVEETNVPRAAQKAWAQAMKAAKAKHWHDAEAQLRAAVEAAPRFTQGWTTLGMVCQNQQEVKEARDAYQRAIALNPKLLAPYLQLTRLDIGLREWEEAGKTADALIKVDTESRYPEAHLHKSIARYHLRDLEGAEAAVNEAIRLDKKHQLPRTEYILGLIFEAKKDYAPAAEHMRKYLELEPKASDAATVRARIDNLGKPEAAGVAVALDAVDAKLPDTKEAWVPGGRKSLAAAVHLKEVPSFQKFFAEYCGALVRHALRVDDEPQAYIETIEAYLTAVAELLREGERRGDAIVVTLSLATEPERRHTEQVLPMLGWRVVQAEGSAKVEPGDRPVDGLRQQIPAVFGIDEIAMQEALEAGRVFQFEISSENARLIGGDAWSALIAGQSPLSGGIAEAFARDPRLAKVYFGLSTMGADTATAVVAGVGARALVLRYADLMARYSEAFALSNGEVASPGGAAAQQVWEKLAGASPRDPPAFFRALLEKDRGKLVQFYSTLSRSDAAHQRFFTRTQQRADRFYRWYLEGEALRSGVTRPAETWQESLFHKLPLDASGNVRFPGGRRAWTSSSASDDDLLFSLGSPQALLDLGQLEEQRETPLDQGSVVQLLRHFAEWRSLFPYFKDLPGLGAGEFEALAGFEEVVAVYPAEKRNVVMGQWHSLVALTVLGVRAGSLNAVEAARAFRRACASSRARDFSAQAVATLREMAGGSSELDKAVRNVLLKLSEPRRLAFQLVCEQQNVPGIEAALRSQDDHVVLSALSGLVYAASLDPRGLLVSEDPFFLSKHRFADASGLFAAPILNLSSTTPGSYVRGGFANFDQIASALAQSRGAVETRPDRAPVDPVAVAGPSDDPVIDAKGEVFRADARLVEVYATVTDARGRYVDDLKGDQFTILEAGREKATVAFESRGSDLSCALVLDTTGSMQNALPALRSAALKLIGELRPNDSTAVYSFNEKVSLLQPFTKDKGAAKRATLHTHAAGATALYDALIQVNHDLSARSGKKVIVVFTDGADNASTLTSETAIRRAKTAGVPVYTIAQGDALRSPEALKQLAGVSRATGGLSFSIQYPAEIRKVFEKIAEDLTHGYLLAFSPTPAQDREWRTIEVRVRGTKNHKVRTREGYYP